MSSSTISAIVPVIATRTVAGSGTASVLTDPVTGQPLDLRTTNGVTSMYVLGGIGHLAASIADTGEIAYQVTYDAYGAETVAKGKTSTQWQQNPYGFKSGLRASNSDSGITKFGYRWISATTGQWIERDTLDEPLSPSDANRYAFVGCDPINGADPTGQISLCSVQLGVNSFCTEYADWLTAAGGAGGLASAGADFAVAAVGFVGGKILKAERPVIKDWYC